MPVWHGSCSKEQGGDSKVERMPLAAAQHRFKNQCYPILDGTMPDGTILNGTMLDGIGHCKLKNELLVSTN